jgi:hypothetical protein
MQIVSKMGVTGSLCANLVNLPLVIFLYRRPRLVGELMEVLKSVRPLKVWLVADGPKNSGEVELCQQARSEAETAIRWPCEVRRVYADANLGLKKRIETGLDQVFEIEEAAVILEEDCHPTPNFFLFCEAMLEKYRNEPKVGAISGNCFLPKKQVLATDYYFSRYVHIWGWSTWARAWKSYDRSRWAWPKQGFCNLFPNAEKTEEAYWNRIFGRMASGELSTWDYSWISWFWMQGWVSITPAQNLVRNVGFGPDATNTRDVLVKTGMEREDLLSAPFQGPMEIKADTELDRAVLLHHLLQQEGRLSFWPRIRRSLAKRVGI